jgi:large subunit ribosomal protein L1
MARQSKIRKKQSEAFERGRIYAADEAFALIRSMAGAKFAESVDVAINLGVDPKKSDQVVRGSTVLPHGTGKTVRVAVFAQGANADAAREAGADIVGMDDLAERVQAGELDFDVVIASPDAMRVVGKLGQILGPRGLMPNPKVGTVSPDVAGAVRNAKSGQVRYRTDRAGTIHCPIGNVTFEPDALRENLAALLADLDKAKPASAKGVYMKNVYVSSTMGPGLQIDRASVAAAGGEAA